MDLRQGNQNPQKPKPLLLGTKHIKKFKKPTSPTLRPLQMAHPSPISQPSQMADLSQIGFLNAFQPIFPNYGLAREQVLLSFMHKLEMCFAMLKSNVQILESNFKNFKNEMQKEIQGFQFVRQVFHEKQDHSCEGLSNNNNNNASVTPQPVVTKQEESTEKDQFSLFDQGSNNNAFECGSPKIEWLQDSSN